MSDKVIDATFVTHLELARAHQHVLGLMGQWATKGENTLGPIDMVTLSPAVRDFFYSLLNTGATVRSGPLFGHRLDDGTLHFEHAAPPGYAVHQDSDQPYRMDPGYLLGWTDALRAQASSAAPLEWLGQWMCFPTRVQPLDRAAQGILDQALAQSLVDHRTALLCVGRQQSDGLSLSVDGWTAIGQMTGLLPVPVTWPKEI